MDPKHGVIKILDSNLALRMQTLLAKQEWVVQKVISQGGHWSGNGQDNLIVFANILTRQLLITTKCRLLVLIKCFCSKQCGPRSDCSTRSSLIWVHMVCLYTKLVLGVSIYMQQMTSAGNIFRCILLVVGKG